ncbi:MAG: site-specific integrase, partial [Candidatus Uhrbacteria bacterium]
VFSLYFCINKQRLLLLSAYILSLFIILGLGKSGLFFGYSGTDPIGLEWQDVDFKRRKINVRRSIVNGIVGTPKNNKGRYVPMTDDLCRALYDDRKTSGLVFCRKDGSAFSQFMVREAIKRICEKSGIKIITWHILRHTFASQLATEGVTIPAIRDLMGHSDISTTMKYAHLAPSTLQSSVDVLEAAEKRETEILGQQVGNNDNFLVQILT